MEREFVTIEREGAIAIVSFDRGGKGNALNRQSILELTDVARTLRDDLGLQAIVLIGSAERFCAGFDLVDENWRMPAGATALERRAAARLGTDMCAAWANLPQITIAAIEGYAIGGGLALAVALDWRLLAADAFVSFPEIRVGLNLGWGTIPRLVSLIGPARAKRAAVLCERIAPDTAERWGLIDEITDPGGTLARARDLARATAALPALPVRMTKETVDAVATAWHGIATHMDHDQGALCFDGPDFRAARDDFSNR